MMIENHRTGLPWKLMRRIPYIWRGLRKAGFAGGWLESEKPQCPRAIEGRWHERATPFVKLAESKPDNERPQADPTQTIRAARIHSYGDPTAVNRTLCSALAPVCRATHWNNPA